MRMPGPNSWMSRPTGQWAGIEPAFRFRRQRNYNATTGYPEARVPPNATQGLHDDTVPTDQQVDVRDFPITGRDGDNIDLRVYTPKTADSQEIYPVLAWAHHGGWSVEKTLPDDALCRYISLHCKIVVVSIDYGILGENKFPGPLNIVHDAIRFISQNYDCIRVDPWKGFVAGGSSAGATMSAVVAHLEKNRMYPPLTGQLLSAGGFLDQTHIGLLPSDIPEGWLDELTSLRDNANASVVSSRTIGYLMTHLAADSKDARISPCLFPKESFERLPNAYFQIAGQDPFRDDGLMYSKQLERGGAMTKVKLFTGVPHAWWEIEALHEARKYVPDLAQGVKWLLGTHKGSSSLGPSLAVQRPSVRSHRRYKSNEKGVRSRQRRSR